ncbi:hypothetical protein V8E36_003598 [Tilletia maclaganii]
MTSRGWTVDALKSRSIDPSLTVAQAEELQRIVARRVKIPASSAGRWTAQDGAAEILIAAMDISYPIDTHLDTAACLVLVKLTLSPPSSSQITLLHTLVHRCPPPSFPYVPGLLAFRELGPLLHLLNELKTQHGIIPDLLLCDGQGIAHPARCGLASHLGVLTGIPSIGSAKSWYIGHEKGLPPSATSSQSAEQERGDAVAPSTDDAHKPAQQARKRRRPSFNTRLPPERGSRLSLYHPSDPHQGSDADTTTAEQDQPIAHVLRSQTNINPIFVSPGHKLSPDQATDLVLALCTRYRIPDPIRWADHASREALREWAAVAAAATAMSPPGDSAGAPLSGAGRETEQ